MKAEKSTFSILFVAQKGKLNSELKAPIFARVTINGEMVHLSTRLYVEPSRWLGKEGRTIGATKEDKLINETIDNFRTLIHGGKPVEVDPDKTEEGVPLKTVEHRHLKTVESDHRKPE
ncbi:MAG: hypothetical protein LBV18_00050 [Alistipes sp.]|nr:hypothetical protein [Alistipes sp.]